MKLWLSSAYDVASFLTRAELAIAGANTLRLGARCRRRRERGSAAWPFFFFNSRENGLGTLVGVGQGVCLVVAV